MCITSGVNSPSRKTKNATDIYQNIKYIDINSEVINALDARSVTRGSIERSPLPEFVPPDPNNQGFNVRGGYRKTSAETKAEQAKRRSTATRRRS